MTDTEQTKRIALTRRWRRVKPARSRLLWRQAGFTTWPPGVVARIFAAPEAQYNVEYCALDTLETDIARWENEQARERD